MERKKYAEELRKLTRLQMSHEQKQDKRRTSLKFAQKFFDEGNNAKALPYMNKYVQLMDLLDEIIRMVAVDEATRQLFETIYKQLDTEGFIGISKISSE